LRNRRREAHLYDVGERIVEVDGFAHRLTLAASPTTLSLLFA
jgi:hypothetical protein